MPWPSAHEQKLLHPVAYVPEVLGDNAAALASAIARTRDRLQPRDPLLGMLLDAHRHGGQAQAAPT